MIGFRTDPTLFLGICNKVDILTVTVYRQAATKTEQMKGYTNGLQT